MSHPSNTSPIAALWAKKQSGEVLTVEERWRLIRHVSRHGHLHTWCDGLTLSRPPHGNALSPEKVKRIIDLDDQGLPRATIAERLGVSINTITTYLKLAGRPLLLGPPVARGERRRQTPISELRRRTG